MSDRRNALTGGPAFARSFRLFAQLAFDTDIVYAHHRDGKTREITVSHADYDGFTGFTHLLTREKALTDGSFPAIPPRKRGFLPLTLLNRIIQYFRILWQFSKKSREWIPGGAKPERFVTAWRFFSAEETERMRRKAREQGISLNSHLFFSLHRAVVPYLQPSRHPATWIIPVSLYEDAEQAKAPGIRTSIMEVNVEDEDTAQTIHRRVRREVDRETYWGAVVAVLINDVLSDGINRKILAATVAKKRRVGTFSNVGRWSGKEQSSDEAWSVVPPVHPGQPLGCGCIEFNGKMGLGMKLDPFLGLDQAGADRLMAAWARNALGEGA